MLVYEIYNVRIPEWFTEITQQGNDLPKTPNPKYLLKTMS